MPHIQLPDLPGILGPMTYDRATAQPLTDLAEVLLRRAATLTPAERELIATSVSSGNECLFCRRSHGAVAAYRLGGRDDVVAAVERDPETAPITPKLKALLAVAAKVRVSGKAVTEADITRAREEGATDQEIHDTVLIAAAFCMFNRYVDGLATNQPYDRAEYLETGARLAEEGYRVPANV